MSVAANVETEEIEIHLLMDGIHRHYGYDFRDYDPAAVKDRIWNQIQSEGLTTISGLQEKIIHEPACMDRFLGELSRGDCAMFDDPAVFSAFRRKVIPLLRTYPFIRIWHVGCANQGEATGSEVYSLAILMWEEGLYDRCKIYVTDVNAGSLRKAKEGIFPLEIMKEYGHNFVNYLSAGGRSTLDHYYTENGDKAIFHPHLKTHLIFSQHHLATDSSFNEFNLILCRNVMTAFNPALKKRVFGLLHHSLCRFGILGLGDRDSMKHNPHRAGYKPLGNGISRLYRRVA